MRTQTSAVAVLGLLAAFIASANGTVQFDIPTQSLADSLRALGAQAHINVIYDPPIVERHVAPALRGAITAEAALAELLKGTGLEYQFVTEKTVSIRIAGTRTSSNTSSIFQPTALPDGEGRGEEGRLHLAQSASSPDLSQREDVPKGADEEAAKLEEIVVTAQKRKEVLKDVPISVSVLSGDELDSSRVQGTTEALSRVPGVSVQENQQGGGTQLSIRGVTTGALFLGSSPVAYYADMIPFGFIRQAIAPDANAYDLERIEVLRGPQGTLYGAGGAAGVVRVLTRDADLNAFEFKARTSVSSTKGGGENYRGDMAVNIPIVDDKLAIRAVAGYNDVGGWIEGPSTRNINDAELTNLRLKINAQPTDKLSLELFAWSSQNEYDALALANDDSEFNSDLAQPTSTSFSAFGGSLSYDFPTFSITSSTSYIDFSNDTDQDIDWLFVFFGADPGNDLITNLDSRVLSEELLFHSTTDSLWAWTFGAFYRKVNDNTYQLLNGSVAADYEDTSESYAVFGEVSRWLVPDELKLDVGLRYFRDDAATQGNSLDFNRYTATSEALTPRAVLTWLPSRDLTVYASYAQGFRSGLLQNEQVTSAIKLFPAAKPDKLTNYEIGTKGNWLNGRGTFEIALYYTDWQDTQSSVTVRFPDGLVGAGIINAGAASGPGIDAALSVEPVDRFTLGVAVGWSNLTINETILDANNNAVATKGQRLAASPEYTASGFAEYVFPIGGQGLEGRLSGSANYTSGRDNSTFFFGVQTSDPLLIGNLSFSVDSPEHWSATLFAENINNEQDAVYPGFVPEWDARIRPRTIGLQFEYRYGR